MREASAISFGLDARQCFDTFCFDGRSAPTAISLLAYFY